MLVFFWSTCGFIAQGNSYKTGFWGVRYFSSFVQLSPI